MAAKNATAAERFLMSVIRATAVLWLTPPEPYDELCPETDQRPEKVDADENQDPSFQVRGDLSEIFLQLGQSFFQGFAGTC